MKRVLTLLLGIAAVFTLSACGEETPVVKATVPTFAGISALKTVTVGDVFDPLAGVTATDTIDGDLTADITVTGTECLLLDADGKLTVGAIECTLTYTVPNSAGLSAMKVSKVTIEKGEPVAGENQIVNGDFEDAGQISVWIKGEFEGGAATVTIDEGKLKVDITEVSWNGQASPRIHQTGLSYETGKTYVVTFDAYAGEARQMVSQVGVLLDGAPWFVSYAEAETFDLTTESQTFTYQFTVIEADTTDGVVTFELGLINEMSIATIVYFDNVTVQELS